MFLISHYAFPTAPIHWADAFRLQTLQRSLSLPVLANAVAQRLDEAYAAPAQAGSSLPSRGEPPMAVDGTGPKRARRG